MATAIISSNPGRRSGFTLVELLVVIGIIVVMLGLLLPTLNRAQQKAQALVCESNLRQIGIAMLSYADEHDGYLFPPDMGWDSAHVNPFPPIPGQPATYNTWPTQVFGIWNPAVMICPSDDNPVGQHSYVINSHLAYWNVRYSSSLPNGISPSDVILMGEKVTDVGDYYMEYGDFQRVVEPYRHGGPLNSQGVYSSNWFYGSNYLMLDMHVQNETPQQAFSMDALDPWDFALSQSAPTTTGD